MYLHFLYHFSREREKKISSEFMYITTHPLKIFSKITLSMHEEISLRVRVERKMKEDKLKIA